MKCLQESWVTPQQLNNQGLQVFRGNIKTGFGTLSSLDIIFFCLGKKQGIFVNNSCIALNYVASKQITSAMLAEIFQE